MCVRDTWHTCQHGFLECHYYTADLKHWRGPGTRHSPWPSPHGKPLPGWQSSSLFQRCCASTNSADPPNLLNAARTRHAHSQPSRAWATDDLFNTGANTEVKLLSSAFYKLWTPALHCGSVHINCTILLFWETPTILGLFTMQSHPGHTKANKPTCWRHPADGTSTEQGGKGKPFSQIDWKRCGLKPATAAYQRELRVLQPVGQSRRLAHGLEQRGPQRTVIISADSPYGGEFLRYLFIALRKASENQNGCYWPQGEYYSWEKHVPWFLKEWKQDWLSLLCKNSKSFFMNQKKL